MNESLEAQQEANKANTEYEEKGKKYEKNPDLAKQNMKKANETFTSKKSPEELDIFQQILEEVENLKLIPENKDKHSDELFEIAEKIVEEREGKENQQNSEEEIKVPESAEPITTKTTEKVGDILDNKNKNNTKGVQGAKDKIQSNLGLDNNQLNEKLNNKEKNISQAKKLLFKKEQINEYSQNTKSANSNISSLEELGDGLIKGEKIVDKDLTDVLSNFVIETGKENLEEYGINNPEAINEALNNAFELQIEKIKDGKVNYRTETVETLKKDILDNDKTNPLEKLEKFKDLKSEIDTSIGSISKKREKATIGEKKLKNKQEKLKNEYKKLNKNPEKNKEKINEIKKEAKEIDKLLKEKKEEKTGTETIGLDFDLNSNSKEKISENS